MGKKSERGLLVTGTGLWIVALALGSMLVHSEIQREKQVEELEKQIPVEDVVSYERD
jgi:hypothetical protein